MSMHEQGYKLTDVEEFDRIEMKKEIPSLILQNGLTTETSTRSYNPTKKEAATS